MDSKKKDTKQKKREESSVATDFGIDGLATDYEDSLQQELRAAINTMGPTTPILSDNRECLDKNKASPKNENNTDLLYRKEKFIENSVSDVESMEILPPSHRKENMDCFSFPVPQVAKYYSPGSSIEKCPCHHMQSYDFGKEKVNRMSRLDQFNFGNNICNWLKIKSSSKKYKPQNNLDYYKMDVYQPEDDNSPPRKLIFNLVDEFPKPKSQNVATNTQKMIANANQKMSTNKTLKRSEESVVHFETINKRNEHFHEKIKDCQCGLPARVDVYYFDHGNASYLRTTDNQPLIKTEIIADKSEECNIKFWAEIFGTVHIGVSFITSFLLQLLRFVLQGIVRPLTVGCLQMGSDYFFKPFLATLFNAVLQPPLILFYNICTSLRDICDPLAEGLGYFIKEVAVLFRACRFIEYRCGKCGVSSKCPKHNENV